MVYFGLLGFVTIKPVNLLLWRWSRHNNLLLLFLLFFNLGLGQIRFNLINISGTLYIFGALSYN